MKDFKVVLYSKTDILRELIKNYLSAIDEYKLDVCEYSEFPTGIEFDNSNDFITLICDISPEDKDDEIIYNIEEFIKNNKKTKVIISDYNYDAEFIVKALRSGKKDFITKPLIKADFISTVKKNILSGINKYSLNGKKKIISVYSNKGGLGKTTISANLAYALYNADKNSRIALVDFNLYTGDIATYLNEDAPFDIKYAIDNLSNVNKDEIYKMGAKYNSSEVYIYANSPYREISKDINTKDIVTFLASLKDCFDYIIVDNPSIIDNKSKTTLEHSDLILVVVGANISALRNTKRCLDFVNNSINEGKTEIVVNRFSDEDECTIEDIEKITEKKVFAKISNDWNIFTNSLNKGETVIEMEPDSIVANEYIDFAKKVIVRLDNE